MIQDFIEWCIQNNLPENKWGPAKEDTLCSYALEYAGEKAGVTIRGAVAAMKVWHIMDSFPWHGGARLNACMKAAENLTPDSLRLPERPPITYKMLEQLDVHLDERDPLDVVVLAAATSMFWGQLRMGEVLSKTQLSYEADSISLRKHLSKALLLAGSHRIFLPRTKTKGSKGDIVVLCCQDDRTDPIKALTAYINLNQPPNLCPLFSFQDKKNALKCLSDKLFIARCNKVWSRLGHKCFTRHCFPIRGTTEVLISEVDPAVVQVMGR
ncbi:unnamed protein product [Mycena citricolor]|uniref:Uncharacterized protein n=1 Tax=Mycena citricolor TaxID=2018698 RepID=A0AAD2HBK3_9AGAR|nr:unnamed protein product [Mycena citricolor]